MLGRLAMLAALGASAAVQEGGPGSAPDLDAVQGGVTHVVLAGELDVGALGVLRRAADQAREHGDVLLIELDTPGGRVDLMWQLAAAIERVSDAGSLTVAWVNDHALSAGALVALSCDRLYMRSRATIGAATPIVETLDGPQAVAAKFSSAFRADFRARAEAHGRNGALAEAMVDAEMQVREIVVDGRPRVVSDNEFKDLNDAGRVERVLRTISPRGQLLSLTGQEAQELSMIDGLKESLEDVIAAVHRRGTQPRTVVRTRSEDFASWVDRWWIVLLFCGLLFGYAELKAPGFGVGGIASIACFTVLLAGRYLAGLADVPQILLVALGAALIAVELFLIPGTLWAGLGGGLLVVAGLVWANMGPGYGLGTPMGRELVFDSAFDTLATAAAAVLGMYVLSLFLPRTPLLGRLATAPTLAGPTAGSALPEASSEHGRVARVGALGRALTDLRPVGKVVLDDARRLEFEARSSGAAVDRGTRVRVIEVHGGRLVVETEAEPSAGGAEA